MGADFGGLSIIISRKIGCKQGLVEIFMHASCFSKRKTLLDFN